MDRQPHARQALHGNAHRASPPWRGVGIVAFLLVITLLLSACAGIPRPMDDAEERLAQAQALEEAQEYQQAADLYLEIAQGLRATPRARVQLEALEILTREDAPQAQRNRAGRLLEEIDRRRLEGDEPARLDILAARLALLEGDPGTALERLPEDPRALPDRLARQALEVEARAHGHREDWIRAVDAWDALGARQPDDDRRQQAFERLWALTQELDPGALEALRDQADRAATRGWLDLGHVARTTPPSPRVLEDALDDWRERHRDHPADPVFLERLREQWAAYTRHPDHVAVLLPLTGRFGSSANAILEGIVAAYYDTPREERTTLRVYDTGEQADASWTQYEKAVEAGASLVIGPLERSAVNRFARESSLPVPVLALNRAETRDSYPDNLYQFGLNPEDEAVQAAERAVLDGHHDAVVMVPRTELGERLHRAFEDRYEALGGLVRDVQFYAPEATDYSDTIIQGLQIRDTRPTHRRRPSDDGRADRDADEPRYRGDVDVIFLSGGPRQARLIRPQLRYYQAGDLPVIATSHIYSGRPDARADADLNGIVFADIPWLLDQVNPRPELRETLNDQLSSTSQQLPRLVALGFDALQVSSMVERLARQRGEYHQGLTGRLHLDEQRRIIRELNWARFIEGEPRVIGIGDGLINPLGDAAW